MGRARGARYREYESLKKLIQGLLLLPWVQQARSEQQKENNPKYDEYLNCGTCRISTTAKRQWHCSQIPSKDWIGPGFVGAITWPEYDTCPGHLIQLPQVIQAARLYLWWGKSQLALAAGVEQVPSIVMTSIELLRSAESAVEAEMMRPKHGHR
jgi:hypothetical protein